MFLLLCSSVLLSLSLSLILASSPLSLGLWILLIALLAAFFCGLALNSWFAFIIFLIYIGGMLVMFAYFSALTPNIPLGIIPLLYTTSISSILIFSLLLTLSPLTPSLISINPTNHQSSITILFCPSNTQLYLLLATILFFALISVVNLTNISSGPLRPFTINYVQPYS